MNENEYINGKLFDIDNSLYYHYLFSSDPNAPTYPNWLIGINQQFLSQLAKEAMAEGYTKIIFGLGTNRGDEKTDRGNGLISCAYAPPTLQSYFAQHTAIQTVADLFMLADIFGLNLQEGDSLKKILYSLTHWQEDIKHAESVFDNTKILLILAHANRLKIFHPKARRIVMDFYDDNKPIANGLLQFYDRFRDLLPDGLRFKVHLYNGQTFKLIGEVIGTGKVDYHYAWSIRYFTFMVPRQITVNYKKIILQLQKPENFQSLNEIHRAQKYFFNHSIPRVVSESGFDMDEFLKFRAHIEQVAPLSPMKAPYTTGKELHAQRLISPYYNIHASYVDWHPKKSIFAGLAMLSAIWLCNQHPKTELSFSYSILLSMGVALAFVLAKTSKPHRFLPMAEDVLKIPEAKEKVKIAYQSSGRFFIQNTAMLIEEKELGYTPSQSK